MNLLDTLLSPDNAAVVQNMSSTLGLGESQTQDALGQLLPALTKALGGNAASGDGLGSLLSALESGNHQRYIDNPELLAQADTITDGNNILGHIFGGKEVSRNVASQAAANTGIGTDILKKMLPIVASVAMGALSQKAAGSAMLGGQGQTLQEGLGGLTSFLDADGDGSITDDLLDMATKSFFK
jgi:hypothetical protein